MKINNPKLTKLKGKKKTTLNHQKRLRNKKHKKKNLLKWANKSRNTKSKTKSTKFKQQNPSANIQN